MAGARRCRAPPRRGGRGLVPAALASAAALAAAVGPSSAWSTSCGPAPRPRLAARVARAAKGGGAAAVDEDWLRDSIGQVDDKEVDRLFSKYDPDSSNSIDREEFQEIAKEMKYDAFRRTALAVLGSALGGVWVGTLGQQYQIAQKLFRGFYASPPAERAMKTFFPTALLANDVNSAVADVLTKRGYTPQNTLYAQSVCPDEINSKAQELVALMQNEWGEAFALGGLGGLPFAGKSGFEAFLHHTPVKGKVLICFAPHVGINTDGAVGSILREGQLKNSTACGAAVGAFNAIRKSDSGGSDLGSAYDAQEKYIVDNMRPLLEGVEDSQDKMAYVAYQTYNIARDLMLDTLKSIPDIYDWCDELTVVGGIMINRNRGGDFFQPLMFETKTKDGAATDLYQQAFGDRPDLAQILGSETKAKQVRASAGW
ncbi:unnamed protein product [Prorocentrum cordatum]|uniref:EF-hand domain-containing protein n=1 Tax=Prorocentrum cordatum TaxID=2364126 RepID=A0ABN9PZK5_9DINO|nr:unnamed protein product [Polarella glacialis]